MFKNREGKVRSGWKIAAVMAVFLGIVTIISIIIGMLSSIYLMSTGDLSSGANAFSLNYTERGEKIMGNINLVTMFLQEVVTILIPIIAWKLISKRRLSDMGLGPIKSHSKELLIGLFFGAISISIVFTALIITGHATVSSWTLHFSPIQLIYLVLFILVGFGEEILGRGYIMSVLRQTKNIPAILIISSIIFALMHSANSGIGVIPYINLALVGVLFAYMYLKSGNIWMPIGYHITWNYFQGYVFGFKVSGMDSEGMLSTSYGTNTILNGGDFGPEGGLFVTLILLLGFLVVRYYYKDKHFDFLSLDPIHTIISNPDLSVAYNNGNRFIDKNTEDNIETINGQGIVNDIEIISNQSIVNDTPENK